MVEARHYFRIAFVLAVMLFLLVTFALLVSMQLEPEIPEKPETAENQARERQGEENQGGEALEGGEEEGGESRPSDSNIGWEQEESGPGREESGYTLSGVTVGVEDENQPV